MWNLKKLYTTSIERLKGKKKAVFLRTAALEERYGHGFPGFPELGQQTGHLGEVQLLPCLPEEECGFPGTKTDLAMVF